MMVRAWVGGRFWLDEQGAGAKEGRFYCPPSRVAACAIQCVTVLCL